VVTVWYADRWERWTVDGEGKLDPLGSGQHPFGQVPLVGFYSEKTGPMQSRSPLAPIADLALELFNVNSLLSVATGYVSLPRLILHSEADLAEVPAGPHTGLTLGPDERAEYLALPPHALEALQSEAHRLQQDIRAQTYFTLDTPRRESAQAQTAEKTRLDMSSLHAALAGWAKNFQEAEQECWKLAARSGRMDESKVQIAYNKKFDLRTNEERLQEAIEASTLDIPSPTFRRELHSQLIRALLDDADPDAVSQAVAELEAAERG
jgi:hypothetical protein